MMSREHTVKQTGRTLLLLVVVICIGLLVACRHKPAYSNVQPSDSAKSRTQRTPEGSPPEGSSPDASKTEGPQPTSVEPQPGELQAVTPEGQPSGSRPAEIKPPPFLDSTTGEFKDLPRYPRAVRTYAQVGPINGIEAGMFVIETAASFERIADFYDQAIKKNGWTVVHNTRDPEYLKWELRKGKTSEALIEVKPATTAEGRSTRRGIILSRAERPEGK